MATHTFYRQATVSRADATASLFKKFPNADLVTFEQKTATAEEAASCGAREGDTIYAATIRVAEFPPAGGSDDSEGETEEKSEPKPEKSEPSDDSGSDDSSESSDDDGDDKSADAPFGGGGDEEPGKPKKMSTDEQILHVLHQILDAVKGGAPLGPDAGGPGDLDLPDIGAPDQGESLPPAGGPAGGKAPLPPPVKEKGPIGVGAFAHYDPKVSEFTVVRADATELGNRSMIAEAAQVYPTHKVARIQRTGSAVINGQEINLAEKKLAVVTLVAK